MAAGPITSPSSWLLGTPAAPSWFQQVQDNINIGLKNFGVLGAPSCALARGAATGTGGSFFTNSTCFDMVGSIQINTGTSTAAGVLGTVTLANTGLATATYVNGMSVFMSPLNAASAAFMTSIYFQSQVSGSNWLSWTMNIGTALTASQVGVFGWNYFVVMS